MNQMNTPLADALKENVRSGYIPFDVPGHKGALQYLKDYFGEECVRLDLNSRKSIDYLNRPEGVIREAEALAAEAFGASGAFFMVGGTTAAIQAMVMSVCKPGEKIILPRNAHYSVFHATILAGAVPVFLYPCVHETLVIPLGIDVNAVRECIRQHPDTKAVLLNHPSYYGVCSDLRAIAALCHEHGIRVLADEAHGTHFYFHEDLPEGAMHCSADMAAVSMHKTGGSFTQSSILLISSGIDAEQVSRIVNLMRTTSPSYLLMASLDLARRNMAIHGRELLAKAMRLTAETRQSIRKIDGFVPFGSQLINDRDVYAFDPLKLSINTRGTGLTGIEVYNFLRDRYRIQAEFGDIENLLAIASVADTEESHFRLTEALRDIQRRDAVPESEIFIPEYIQSEPVISPRRAFYSSLEELPPEKCLNRISGSFLSLYPPGIPILIPGERVTSEAIRHICYATQKGCQVSGLNRQGKMAVVLDP